MRLRLFSRARRAARRALARDGQPPARQDPAPRRAPSGQGGSHRRTSPSAASASTPPPVPSVPPHGPFPPPAPTLGASATPVTPVRPSGPAVSRGGAAGAAAQAGHRRWGTARTAIRPAAGSADISAPAPVAARRAARAAASAVTAKAPWYEVAQANRTVAGRRHCGRLEEVLERDWAQDAVPPPEIVTAIDRLAELPRLIKEKLAAGLDAIFVGPGGVPDLDDMGSLSGVMLPSGRATWDACAGAYGERKIIVGSRPSPTPDVMCHEVGHALDDIDGTGGLWQSDSEDFRALYEQCMRHLASSFHRQQGPIGRREFFADAFAAIASGQRPALVDMLGGNTRAALNVMLYFNVRYGI